MSLSAVLFDMDGLLVDTEPMWLQAEHATMAVLGGSWTEADQAAILGASMDRAAAYFQARSGTDLAHAEIAEVLVQQMLLVLSREEIPTRPGAEELIHAVAASDVPYALVSASVRPIVDVVLASLAARGLPAFPVTVAGDEVERGKPDPLPYLTAAARLGVDPRRAVALEDSPNGVLSARGSGATVVAVPHAVTVPAGPGIHIRASLAGLGVGDLAALVPPGGRPVDEPAAPGHGPA